MGKPFGRPSELFALSRFCKNMQRLIRELICLRPLRVRPSPSQPPACFFLPMATSSAVRSPSSYERPHRAYLPLVVIPYHRGPVQGPPSLRHSPLTRRIPAQSTPHGHDGFWENPTLIKNYALMQL